MKRILYGIAVLIALLPGIINHAQAQTVRELSLEDAMEYAVKNNYTVRNARLDVLLQQAKNAEITGLALPNISADARYTDYINPIQTFVPAQFANPAAPPGSFIPVQFTPKYSSALNVNGSQVIFDGSVFVALQARNTIVKLVEQNAGLTEENIRYNVQKAYYSLVVAYRQYDILKQAIANVRRMAKDQEVLRQNGFVEKIEVDRTNVQINNLVTDSIRIGNLLVVSEQLLKYQMGMDIDQPISLTDTSISGNIAVAKDLLSEDVNYSNRTEFNLLQTQLKLNKYDLKRHRLSYIPTLAAFGSLGYSYSTNEFRDLFDETYIFSSLWGLQLNVPIFDGLQRYNRVKQAKINIEKTNLDIESLKLGIDFQSKQSRATLKNSLLALYSQEENMRLANNVLDLAERKYKEGVGSNLEVTLAQTELLNAQNNYFQSLLTVINAQSDLQNALGQFKK